MASPDDQRLTSGSRQARQRPSSRSPDRCLRRETLTWQVRSLVPVAHRAWWTPSGGEDPPLSGGCRRERRRGGRRPTPARCDRAREPGGRPAHRYCGAYRAKAAHPDSDDPAECLYLGDRGRKRQETSREAAAVPFPGRSNAYARRGGSDCSPRHSCTTPGTSTHAGDWCAGEGGGRRGSRPRRRHPPARVRTHWGTRRDAGARIAGGSRRRADDHGFLRQVLAAMSGWAHASRPAQHRARGALALGEGALRGRVRASVARVRPQRAPRFTRFMRLAGRARHLPKPERTAGVPIRLRVHSLSSTPLHRRAKPPIPAGRFGLCEAAPRRRRARGSRCSSRPLEHDLTDNPFLHARNPVLLRVLAATAATERRVTRSPAAVGSTSSISWVRARWSGGALDKSSARRARR